jgi:hypothetical protein
MTDDEILKAIQKGRFPKEMQYGVRQQIRDLWIEGKDAQAIKKWRDLQRIPVLEKTGKTLL